MPIATFSLQGTHRLSIISQPRYPGEGEGVCGGGNLYSFLTTCHFQDARDRMQENSNLFRDNPGRSEMCIMGQVKTLVSFQDFLYVPDIFVNWSFQYKIIVPKIHLEVP